MGEEPETDRGATEPVIVVDGVEFATWHDYTHSALFREQGLRCLTLPQNVNNPLQGGGAGDCSFSTTNPDPVYDPSVVRYRIPVVVHVIRNTSGSQGNISISMVESQIQIINEDFLALPGTNGSPGTDIQIEFYLAEEDPNGNPTNGITYSNNTTWFNDQGSYWNSLAWDTNRYCNIYTNSASGALGYVPNLPQGGIVGLNADRIVILWSSFGLNAPIGPPYNKGRTVTHELGHYFGLLHTFSGGCASASNCYNNGDLICDTNPEGSPTFGCFDSNSCSSPNPYHNYMDYSDDLCMWEFTPEQALRERCSLEHYRSNLFEIAGCTSAAECDDGVTCTLDSCDDVTHQCVNLAVDDLCPDDGVFCNGPEVCARGGGDPVTGCASTGAPCAGCTEEEQCPCVTPTVDGFATRYLAITPAAGADPVALVVTTCGGIYPLYVGALPGETAPVPVDLTNNGSIDGSIAGLVENAADALFLTPAEWGGQVFVTGLLVVPGQSFEVRADCGGPGASNFSDSAVAITPAFGDVNEDGVANLADAQLVVLGFQGVFVGNNNMLRSDIADCFPNQVDNLADAFFVVKAFQQVPMANACPESYDCP